MVECVTVMAVVTGCQRVDYPGSTLALSSAGLGDETWEPCLFWMLEKACVDLFNILGSKMAGIPLGNSQGLWVGALCDKIPGTHRQRSDEHTGSYPTPGPDVSELGAKWLVHPCFSRLS